MNRKLTFRSLESYQFAVFPLSGAIESFDPGIVERVEVKAIYCTYGFFPAIYFLWSREKYG